MSDQDDERFSNSSGLLIPPPFDVFTREEIDEAERLLREKEPELLEEVAELRLFGGDEGNLKYQQLRKHMILLPRFSPYEVYRDRLVAAAIWCARQRIKLERGLSDEDIERAKAEIRARPRPVWKVFSDEEISAAEHFLREREPELLEILAFNGLKQEELFPVDLGYKAHRTFKSMPEFEDLDLSRLVSLVIDAAIKRLKEEAAQGKPLPVCIDFSDEDIAAATAFLKNMNPALFQHVAECDPEGGVGWVQWTELYDILSRFPQVAGDHVNIVRLALLVKELAWKQLHQRDSGYRERL